LLSKQHILSGYKKGLICMNRREMYPAMADLSQKIHRAAAGKGEEFAFDCYYNVAKAFIMPVSREAAGDLFSKLSRVLTLTKMLHTEGGEKLKSTLLPMVQKWCSQLDMFLSSHSMGAHSMGGAGRHTRLLEILQAMEDTLQRMSAVLCTAPQKGEGCAVLLVGTLYGIYDTLMQIAVS